MTMTARVATVSLLLLFLVETLSAWSNTPLRNSKNRNVFRLVSWNLLAPIHARPEKYPWVSPDMLDWNHRQALILHKLQELNADIYCLQEIQVEQWDEFLQKMPNYHGVLQEMKGNHPVAVAILIKKTIPLEIVRTESRSRALLMVLHCTKTEEHKEPFFLANVHLDAGRDNDQTRFFQLRSLLKRLVRHMDLEDIPLSKETMETTPPRIVIAGDMNMLHSADIYKYLSTGSLPWDETVTHKLLPLQDAYAKEHISGGLQFTYGGGCVLDYIWTSKSVQVVETMPVKADKDETQTTMEMPSKTHPSDHLPIGVSLSFPSYTLDTINKDLNNTSRMKQPRRQKVTTSSTGEKS